jgi:serine protease DegS
VGVVLRGGAAEKAGLKAGDVLIEIDGHPVLTLEAVRQALAEVSIDAPLPLTVIRGDDQMSVVITRPRRP